jgi:hypothetical protein
MAIQNDGLQFHPLYWIFHDNYRYYRRNTTTVGDVQTTSLEEFDHYGHMHLFMMSMPWGDGQDAFSGFQNYHFELQDVWGPRSGDPNQQMQYRVVGTPKWYFHVEELWRRVYIQPWDMAVPNDDISAKRGIKYEACDRDLVAGPFREGRDAATRTDFAPAFIRGARTLPLEYFTNNERSQAPGDRENFIAQRAASISQAWAEARATELLLVTYPGADWPASLFASTVATELAKVYNPDTYALNHGPYLYAGGNDPFSGEVSPHPAAVPPFGDNLYIYPIMEYQTVTQLAWQRLPGAEVANDVDDETFGDGWSLDVQIPFRHPATGQYNSPFGATPGVVSPIGQYHGLNGQGEPLVPTARRMKHATVTYAEDESEGTPEAPANLYDHPQKLDPALSGQLAAFHDPYGDTTGKWVQQCLGGIVQARAKVTIESKLGGRQDIWVATVQYLPSTPFAGNDQALPIGAAP